jgi:hypothetical protein
MRAATRLYVALRSVFIHNPGVKISLGLLLAHILCYSARSQNKFALETHSWGRMCWYAYAARAYNIKPAITHSKPTTMQLNNMHPELVNGSLCWNRARVLVTSLLLAETCLAHRAAYHNQSRITTKS